MNRYWPLLLILLPGGCLVAALVWWRRQQAEAQRTDLVPRWKAFLETPPVDGEKWIPPANVPAVRRLKGVTVDPYAWWRKAGQR